MSKKVLIVTGDGAEVLEVYYPYYRLLEEGYEAVIASPTKKVLHTVVHDFIEGWETFSEKPAHLLPSHLAFADVDPAEYIGLIIPGGRAPEYIRSDDQVALESCSIFLMLTNLSAQFAMVLRYSPL